jgi:hypothetical protein
MNKISITISTLFLVCMMGHYTYAQEQISLDILAQEYLERATQQVDQTSNLSSSDTIVVNREAIVESAITESIDTITRTTQEINELKTQTIEQLKELIKTDIDTAIIEIRKQTNKEAYLLQRIIDEERTTLFETITSTVNNLGDIEELQESIMSSIQTIQTNLEAEAFGIIISFDVSQESVIQILNEFEQKLIEKKEILNTREGELIYMDTDQDGVSDYEEIYIYKTDPNNAYTIEGELSDGQKISRGINPLSQTQEKKQYQDPRDDRKSFVSDMFTVDKVQLIKDENILVFEGIALPNSFITLYIFSTPIIVTVKTDENGLWSYELKEELENGEHKIYVANVDSSGKIVARSNPILFTKSAEAAAIGIAADLNSTVGAQNFLQDNFILVVLAILIVVVILGMMFVGNHRNIRSVIVELKDEVNGK